MQATTTRPDRRSAGLIEDREASKSSSSFCALGKNCRPGIVTSTRRVVRFSNATPTPASSFWIRRSQRRRRYVEDLRSILKGAKFGDDGERANQFEVYSCHYCTMHKNIIVNCNLHQVLSSYNRSLSPYRAY